MTTASPTVDLVSAELVEDEGRAPSAWRAVLRSAEGRIGVALAIFIALALAEQSIWGRRIS